MKCNRCGKEIEEIEIFCDDCKKHLREFSSRREVKELEELIENQKTFDDLENTKELVNLDKLVDEELIKEENIEENFEKESVKDVVKDIAREDNEFSDIEKEEKKKKKIIIIVSIVLGVLILIGVLLGLLLGKKENVEVPEVVIDYEKVINSYGDSVKEVVDEYLKTNEDIPTWQYVLENIDYDRYEVECDNHVIYTDGNIYLSECKVNNKVTKYTYGEEQEEVKEGKKITIYKEDYNGFFVYSNELNKNTTEAGFITCKTEECSYISAYEKYV